MEIRDPRQLNFQGFAGFLNPQANTADGTPVVADRSSSESPSEFSANFLRQLLLNHSALAGRVASERTRAGERIDQPFSAADNSRATSLSSRESSLRSLSKENRSSQAGQLLRSGDSASSLKHRRTNEVSEDPRRDDDPALRSSSVTRHSDPNKREALAADRGVSVVDEDRPALDLSRDDTQAQPHDEQNLGLASDVHPVPDIEAKAAEDISQGEKLVELAEESLPVVDLAQRVRTNSDSSNLAAENAALNVSNSFKDPENQIPPEGIVSVDDGGATVTLEPDSVSTTIANPSAANRFQHLASRLVSTKSNDEASIRALQSFERLLGQEANQQAISGNKPLTESGTESLSGTVSEFESSIETSPGDATTLNVVLTSNSPASDPASISEADSSGALPPVTSSLEQATNPQATASETAPVPTVTNSPVNGMASLNLSGSNNSQTGKTAGPVANQSMNSTIPTRSAPSAPSLQAQSESLNDERAAGRESSAVPGSGSVTGKRTGFARQTSWSAAGGVPLWSSLPGLSDSLASSTTNGLLKIKSLPGTLATALATTFSSASRPETDALATATTQTETATQKTATQLVLSSPGANVSTASDLLIRETSATTSGSKPGDVVQGILNMTASSILSAARTEQSFSIVLTPESYGELSIDVRQNEEGVMVRLEAATPAGHELLNEHLSELREILDVRGLDVDQISIERLDAPREVHSTSDQPNDRSSNREQADSKGQNFPTGQESSSGSGNGRHSDSGPARENLWPAEPQEESRLANFGQNQQEARSTPTTVSAIEGSARPVRWEHVNIQI